MMRKVLLLLSLVFLIAACGKKEQEQEQNDVVGKTAQQYYKSLIKGDYEAFVDGTYHEGSIRETYREGLIENAKMYVGQLEKDHEGISSVDIDSTNVDEKHGQAEVFLNLNYGDSTKEQILVPMIKIKDEWYMK